MWEPMPLTRKDKVATAGSCFAQHLGHNLKLRGAQFMDMEPAPPVFADTTDARRFGFGVFSCRTGNIYTTRQLLHLMEEATGRRETPRDVVWKAGERFVDALRPNIDPVGQDTPSDVRKLRQAHLAAVRRMFEELDVMVFTLGLTEAWENRETGTIYPAAPGTIAGHYDPDKHGFVNFGFPEVLADLEKSWALLREINPSARMLLTVSPVPLIATASPDHVLVATTHSKSILRAVAGEMAQRHDDIHYFPSYEIITAPAGGGRFFDPDQRGVNPVGVSFVMQQFFSGPLALEFGTGQPGAAADLDVVCDEEAMLRAEK